MGLVQVSNEATTNDVLRTRMLIIEDEQGRDRIVLGAPIPDPRNYTGMKILAPGGEEQFAVSLKGDGSVGMGFDTAPGVGDARNRERLNLGVTADGRAWFRFLDNETRAKLFLRTDDEEMPRLEFLDWSQEGKIVWRKIGFDGEEVVETER